MPDQVLQLFGLGIPFALAGGTYKVFHFLDAKMSPAARNAVSSSLRSGNCFSVRLPPWVNSKRFARLIIAIEVVSRPL